MDDSGSHALASSEHRLVRLTFFSDAVFAIAITLLIIEIRVPEAHALTDAAFLAILSDLLPKFIGFVVSFAVVGSFWAGHHRAFACAQHWSPRIVPWNLTLLGLIASGPFFTAFASEYAGQRVPVALYALWLLATALLHIRLQRLVTHAPIVGAGVSADYLAITRGRGVAVALGAVTAFGVALVAPAWALPSLLSILLWRALLLADLRRRRRD